MSAERKHSRLWWLLAVFPAAGLCFFVACNGENGKIDHKEPEKQLSLEEQLKALPDQQYLVHKANGEILTDIYRDITAASGIDFTFHNGQEANHFAILESLGG